MKKLRYTILTLSIIALLIFLAKPTKAEVTLTPLYRNGVLIKHRGTENSVMTPTTYTEKEFEFRGAWVPTVWNLAMPKHTSETQYKDYFRALISRVKSKNINAILLQTRPLNDTFYESDYAPYSRYLTGTEGVSPGWDAMGWMVDYAHQEGIKIHAWLNPYRVVNSNKTKAEYLATLHADNFAKKNPDFVIAGTPNSSGVYPYILDPGRPEVKTYIQNVVSELITKYDVDGVHFDDYFYPYGGTPESEDQTTFNLYNPGNLSRADWRRKNVDDVVEGIKNLIDTHNTNKSKNVKFGISPFGIWRNKGTDPLGSNTAGLQSYDAQYADSRKWVKNNWLHYITPQVYWQFTHAVAPYADVVDWWANTVRGTKVDLIVGHSITSTELPEDEIVAQINYNQKYPEIRGSILYSAGLNTGSTNYLARPVINNLTATNWKTNVTNNYDASAPGRTLKRELDSYYFNTLNTSNYQTTKNINLITAIAEHTITWTSSNPSVISNSGIVTRPPHTASNITVNLTAKNQNNETVTYPVTVLKQEAPPPPEVINPPTVEITGDLNEDGIYEGPVTIKFTADYGLNIEYLYTDGITTSPLQNYTGSFVFNKRGGYAFTVYAKNPSTNERSEPLRFNIRVSIPYDESATRVIRNGNPVKFKETGREIVLKTYYENDREVRAVWVATVTNIDVPQYQNDEQYKAYLIDILDTVKALNMNTVFFQVRSMNDAFFPSRLAPYSQYIKGVPGEGLDWDILEFMVTEAHKRDIELHAWLNPYRVMNKRTGTKLDKLNSLHPDNFARKNPNLVMEDNQGALILNPGEPEVRQYIYDVIAEIMENYQVDGIHMDDYFYTYGGHSSEHDASAFRNYNPDNLPLADWRRSNVDTLVREIFEQVEEFNETNNRNVKWGISPIGIWRSIEDDPNGSYNGRYAASSYRDQFADTRKWVKEGWLHYINPQVYWEFSRDIAPYADLVKWWNDQAEGTNVKVLVGQGFYRMVESGTSMNNENEMIEQIRFNQSYRNVIGTVFFSYRTLKNTHPYAVSTIERLGQTYWTEPARWSWPTDVKEPDTPEITAAKDVLQTVVDDVRTYLISVTATKETDPLKLNEGELYASQDDINNLYAEIANATMMIENRGYIVPVINNQKNILNDAFNLFKTKVITGTGAEVDSLAEINELLGELVQLIESYKIASTTNASSLPKGEKYITIQKRNELNHQLAEFRSYLTEERTEEELLAHLASIQEFESNLDEHLITGTKGLPILQIALFSLAGLFIVMVVVKRKKK